MSNIAWIGNTAVLHADGLYSCTYSDLWLILSPILLHNMGNPPIVRLNPLPKSTHTTSSTAKPKSTATATTTSDDFPVAKSISIARVASEYSMQKKYQPLFIQALKEYFKNSKRICKEGDLIAVPFDESKSMFYYKEGNGENGSAEVQEEIQDFE